MTDHTPTPRTDALRKQFENWTNATDRFHDEEQEKFWKMVQEMERAIANSAIPPGWKLVPVEPTPEMRSAYKDALAALISHRLEHGIDSRWKRNKRGYVVRDSEKLDARWGAMLAAAPEASGSPSQAVPAHYPRALPGAHRGAAREVAALTEDRIIPGGWKLVPAVPTEAQLKAIDGWIGSWTGIWSSDREGCIKAYEAMIAAAPEPPVVARVEERTDTARLDWLQSSGRQLYPMIRGQWAVTKVSTPARDNVRDAIDDAMNEAPEERR